jgi:hypothetical protein
VDQTPDDVRARVDEALAQVVQAVRRMPPGRLRSAGRVGAARALARDLATAVQGIEQAESAAPPTWRMLPDVPDLVVGDQLAVLAHDFSLAMPEAPEQVWTPHGRAPLSDVLGDLLLVITNTNGVL